MEGNVRQWKANGCNGSGGWLRWLHCLRRTTESVDGGGDNANDERKRLVQSVRLFGVDVVVFLFSPSRSPEVKKMPEVCSHTCTMRVRKDQSALMWIGWWLFGWFSRGGRVDCRSRVDGCIRLPSQQLVSPFDRIAFGGEPAFPCFLQHLLHDRAKVEGHLHRHIRHECLGFASDGGHQVALGFFSRGEAVGQRKWR